MKKLLFFMGVVFTVTSCTSYKYSSVNNYKEKGEHKYKTYAFAPESQLTASSSYDNDAAKNQIIALTSATLNLKGLKQVSNQPDLLIKYTAVENADVKNQINYAQPLLYNKGRGINLYGYNGVFTGNISANNVKKSILKKGLIIIDIIDPKTSQLVWSGSAEGELANSTQAIKDIPSVLAGIFKTIPVLD